MQISGELATFDLSYYQHSPLTLVEIVQIGYLGSAAFSDLPASDPGDIVVKSERCRRKENTMAVENGCNSIGTVVDDPGLSKMLEFIE